MRNKGITLIALVITIIVLMILAGVSLSLTIGENGILSKAREAKIAHEKATIKEEITMESVALDREREEVKSGKKTDREVFGILQYKLEEKPDLKDTNYLTKSKFMMITTKQGYIFTVLYDGTVLEGKYALLDIADGSIQLKGNGYIQGTDSFIQYDGKYIITGTTTENNVSVMEKGTYDITIKDLNIDVSNKNNVIAFLAGNINIGLNVILRIDGVNKLIAGNTSSLSWSGITANENGSTLKLCGNGSLETTCGNSDSAYCIGGNNAKNIVIDSGNISAIKKGEKYGNPIGGNGSIIIFNGRKYNCKF